MKKLGEFWIVVCGFIEVGVTRSERASALHEEGRRGVVKLKGSRAVCKINFCLVCFHSARQSTLDTRALCVLVSLVIVFVGGGGVGEKMLESRYTSCQVFATPPETFLCAVSMKMQNNTECTFFFPEKSRPVQTSAVKSLV